MRDNIPVYILPDRSITTNARQANAAWREYAERCDAEARTAGRYDGATFTVAAPVGSTIITITTT